MAPSVASGELEVQPSPYCRTACKGGTDLQTYNVNIIDHRGQVRSCEIIQDIFALGANCFLRENEEELYQRMLLKYRRQANELGGANSARDTVNEQGLEILIRRTLFLRKAELAIATSKTPARKESLRSTTARPLTGAAGKGAGDSVPATRRIGLA